MTTLNFKPSPYKISTITATGGVNTEVNLDILYKSIEILDEKNSSDDGFMYIEFGRKKSDTFYRGTNKKLKVSRRKKVEAKRFDNQATVIVRYTENGAQLMVNMKIFKNGNVQITGLKYIDQGRVVINKLIAELKRIYVEDKGIVKDYEKLDNIQYCIRLINSDFRIGFEIKRERLYRLLHTDYNIRSSYEPCIYPGVKVQYYWNSAKNDNQNGICECSSHCQGKGSGDGPNECKKITIAIFQSGCIIITGAQCLKQIDDAYKFICIVIDDNINDLKKIEFQPQQCLK
jgi:TATA-box binding protein (TBP) (component of TFIID and TFIIIB)